MSRDRSHHGLVDIHMLDFHIGDLDAPGVGLSIEDLLNIRIELVAFGSISSSSCLPRTERSVVWASSLVACMRFSTWIVAGSGATTRK